MSDKKELNNEELDKVTGGLRVSQGVTNAARMNSFGNNVSVSQNQNQKFVQAQATLGQGSLAQNKLSQGSLAQNKFGQGSLGQNGLGQGQGLEQGNMASLSNENSGVTKK